MTAAGSLSRARPQPPRSCRAPPLRRLHQMAAFAQVVHHHATVEEGEVAEHVFDLALALAAAVRTVYHLDHVLEPLQLAQRWLDALGEDGVHHELFVHESLPAVPVALRHLEVPIVGDLSSNGADFLP